MAEPINNSVVENVGQPQQQQNSGNFWQRLGSWAKTGSGSSILGGAINGLFNLGGALISGYQSRKLAQQQNQYNLEMWNKQNEYNTPQAQKQRLLDAGLNPALMYGNGSASTGLAESPSPASDAALSSPQFIMDGMRAGGTAIQNMMRNAAELEQIEAQTDLLRAQADESRGMLPFRQRLMESNAALATANTSHIEIRNKLLDLDYDLAVMTQDLRYDEFVTRVQQQKQELNAITEQVRQLTKRGEYLEPELQMNLLMKYQQLAMNELAIAAQKAGIQLTYAQCEYYASMVLNLAADTDLKKASQAGIEAQTAWQVGRNNRQDEFLSEELKGLKADRIIGYINSGANVVGTVGDLCATFFTRGLNKALPSGSYDPNKRRTDGGLWIPNSKETDIYSPIVWK